MNVLWLILHPSISDLQMVITDARASVSKIVMMIFCLKDVRGYEVIFKQTSVFHLKNIKKPSMIVVMF